jgi:FkbM family methyltransferase
MAPSVRLSVLAEQGWRRYAILLAIPLAALVVLTIRLHRDTSGARANIAHCTTGVGGALELAFGKRPSELAFDSDVCGIGFAHTVGNVENEPTPMMCVDDKYKLSGPDCTVISIGVAYNFLFDDTMLARGCRVFSFDPSMAPGNYKRSSRHSFHHLGIGTKDGAHVGESTLYQTYNQRVTQYEIVTLDTILSTIVKAESVSLLRMDVEGAEWDVLQSWVESGVFRAGKIKQLMIEAHFFNSDEVQAQGRILGQVAQQMRRFWLSPNRGSGTDAARENQRLGSWGTELDDDVVCARAYEIGFVV